MRLRALQILVLGVLIALWYVFTAPGLIPNFYFEQDNPPFAYGVHAVVVDVDPETGAVRLDRYVVVSDAGRLINPTIAEGQIVGGLTQGLGGALLEHLVYDGQGQLVTSSLMDYALPIARDVPPVEVVHLQIPTPLNPLGVKGLREGGAGQKRVEGPAMRRVPQLS